MTFYLKKGKTFKVSTKEALDIHETLPVATYTVGFDDNSGQFFLETIDSFEIKGKLYGDTTRNCDRILQTFQERDVCTGVLLAGERGSGKTMLAKQISIVAAQRDSVPTIVVNQPWCGEQFNSFMQMIQQPTIVIFDEFEKVYSASGKQEAMLTLLDGVYQSKKLFLLTCNDKWKVNSYMRNRPGRIFYMLEYHGVDIEFVREYCSDNLKNQDHIEMVCDISKIFRAFNFDMLKALVEEMNRYDETPAEALKFLNARPGFDNTASYRPSLTIKGKKIDIDSSNNTWSGNPMKDPVRIYYYTKKKDGRRVHESVTFNPSQFQHTDERTGGFLFVDEKKKRQLLLRPLKSNFEVDFRVIESSPDGKKKDFLRTNVPTPEADDGDDDDQSCSDESDLIDAGDY